MNIENILKLIEFLRENEEHKKFEFNMDSYAEGDGNLDTQMYDPDISLETIPHFCNTACCIAGAASIFLNKDPFVDVYGETPIYVDEIFHGISHYDRAMEYLGLTDGQAHKLFHPWEHFNIRSKEITTEWAIMVLENLIITGKVDWTICAEGIQTRNRMGGFDEY